MVNTAKRRLSTRIHTRGAAVNALSSNATPLSRSASRSPSSHLDQPSFDIHDQAPPPSRTESHHRIPTRTTRHNTQPQDTVPEIAPAADQTSPLANPVMPSTSGNSSTLGTTSGHDKNGDVISWILQNYERMPNSNVPRSSIFEHYQSYCSLRHMKPVNAATFGKLIRMTFPGISTRRLGNRGQSKYQYCNIQRIETRQNDSSDLTELPATNSMESYEQQQQQQQHIEGLDSNTTGTLINWDTDTDQATSRSTTTSYTSMLPSTSSSENNNLHSIYDTHGFPSYRLPPPIGFTPSSSSSSSSSPLSLAPHLGDLVSDFSGPNKSYQQNYSPPSPTRLASSSTLASASSQPALNTTNLTDVFANLYNQHCRELYNTIYAGQFDQIQGIYERFYYETPNHYRSLLNTPKMVEAVWRWDCVLYDSLIVILLPEVDTPMTDRMMSGLVQFTQTLPKFLSYLLRDYSAILRQTKCQVASIFVAKLRRHLTLNQYAVIASDVLRQSNLVENMKADWKNLDFDAILDHVSWICDCQSDDIRQILAQDIPRLLNDGNTLGKWMEWEENLIHKYLPNGPKTREKQHIDECLNIAKQFMLKWKVYTGSLVQEFYVMDTPSIGKTLTQKLVSTCKITDCLFMIISNLDSLKALLYFLDDLVLYHVEERIANMNAGLQLTTQS
ncbi:unnamed protein product [Absidia cylindrospora]